jgi:hypothetical protein
VTTLRGRIGVEIELIAPPGVHRGVLARRVARASGGAARRVFHTDSEPSLVPGMGHFWHLTPAWEVTDADGAPVASFVDDITIAEDLRREQATAPRPGPRGPRGVDDLYRVLSDAPRLLRLVARHSDPEAPFARSLDEVARLVGTSVETVGAVRRLRDEGGASIAMAAPLAPGRERPCEIVTAPLTADHETALEALLRPARELGFTVPVESAAHLHVDGARFRSAHAFSNLVRLFGHWREALHVLLETNPACTRLAPLPPALLALVETDPLLELTPSGSDSRSGSDSGSGPGTGRGGDAHDRRWHRLQQAAAGTGLVKYADVNLTALLTDAPVRDTVEVRILPGSLDTSAITDRAGLVERLLDRCLEEAPFPSPTDAGDPARTAIELRRLADA